MSTILKNTVIPLYINSKDRTNIADPTTNFSFTLRKDLRNISSINVTNVGIPFSYTNINVNNNTLLISFSAEGKESIVTQMVVDVDSKEHTGSTLAIALQNSLDLNAVSVSLGLDWTIAFDTDSQFYSVSVQYDAGASIVWSIIFTYTPLLDALGIGSGGTTDINYTYSAENTDTLIIPVNRRSVLFNNLHLNITSKALTNDINTSYVTSLAKSFNIDSNNSLVAFDVKQTLTKYSSQLELGTESIGDVFFGYTLDIDGSGNTFITGAYADDGYVGSTYTYIKQTNGVDYFQTPNGKKTQTTLPASANGREGTAVAISKNGFTMITGASEDDWNLLLNKRLGAAYIYAWTGAQWVLQTKITPSSETPVDQQLGLQVAISGDGNTVAASGINETVLYVKNANKWEEGKKLPFTTHPQFNDDGTIMTLYAPNTGTIQVWGLSGITWVLGQSITDPYPVLDMSDDGSVFVTTGNGSVNVYKDTGSYTIDTGAPLVQAFSEFGTSTSISGDGTTIVVGDPTTNPGSVWVYTKPVATWILHSQVSAITASPNNPFQGFSVRLNTDGTVFITGGPASDNNIGSAWVWKLDLSDDTWKEASSNPVFPNGYSADTDQGYSSSIAQGGAVFATGGPVDNGEIGAAWVYTRDQFTWSQNGSKLLPSDISDTTARFGHSIDISADASVIIVGAPQDFGGGSSSADDTGAVWFFRDSSGSGAGPWVQDGTKIYGAPFAHDNHQGRSVSINGDGQLCVVGAPGTTVPNTGDGKAFVFAYDSDTKTWGQQGSVLSHSGVSSTSAQGWAVAIDAAGDTIALGCPGDNSVAIFERSGITWVEGEVLTGTGVRYGSAVAISSDGFTLAIGAPGSSAGDLGYVTVLIKEDGVWEEQYIVSNTPFGSSVDLSADGNVLCVGSLDGLSQSDITSRTYAYVRTEGVWAQFDDPIVGEKRTNTEDYQGFSSSVEYIDETSGFVLIIGGIGFGAFQGGNWSYISNGLFNTIETFTLPVRSYTIYDLITVLNNGLQLLNMDFVYLFNTLTETVTLSVNHVTNVNVTFQMHLSNTFDIIEFITAVYGTAFESSELDFSINNNIIKTIDTSSITNSIIYDTTVDLLFRKYEAGFSLLATDVIDIQLRDERDRIIDLHGSDWVMSAYATIHN